jgi:TetR/AcrR family transcriptional repressor of nem operon
MRVDRHTAAAHRTAILEAAGRLFRRGGFATMPLARITREAGLTHGAFYGHFASKNALAAESCRGLLEDAAAHWTRRAEHARAQGQDALAALIASYLTERHRDSPEQGCVLATLAPEVLRAPGPLSEALANGAAALTAVLDHEISLVEPTMGQADRARTAHAVLATLIGGIILARALRADPDRSRAALAGAAELAGAALPGRRS